MCNGGQCRSVYPEGDLVEGYKAPSALFFLGFVLTGRFQNLSGCEFVRSKSSDEVRIFD